LELGGAVCSTCEIWAVEKYWSEGCRSRREWSKRNAHHHVRNQNIRGNNKSKRSGGCRPTEGGSAGKTVKKKKSNVQRKVEHDWKKKPDLEGARVPKHQQGDSGRKKKNKWQEGTTKKEYLGGREGQKVVRKKIGWGETRI